MNTCETEYMNWLIDAVNDREGEDYYRLLKYLYKKEFYSLVEYDQNRAEDGVALRGIWQEANGLSNEEVDFGVAKVLEVLIGIVKRIRHEIYGSKWAETMGDSDIFWVLLGNLGLERFSDKEIESTRIEQLDSIVEVWLERRYNRNGLGGIFCVFRATANFRKLELWDQMGIYIRENWPI